MKYLITGITGMVGSHMADLILREDPRCRIVGVVRPRSPLHNIAHILNRIELQEADLTDYSAMFSVAASYVYDAVFHFGAQTFVPYSLKSPVLTYQTNIIGTHNLLDAFCNTGGACYIQVCSSSEVYGKSTGKSLTEKAPLAPVSPYGISKAGADLIGQLYANTYKMSVTVTRAFTHTGPRRGAEFVASSFARQIVHVENGKKETVHVGNLGSLRTWCDVRDMVRAYWLLYKNEGRGVYNIGGYRSETVGTVLAILKSYANKPISHRVRQHLMRPDDVMYQLPDVSKFRKLANWEPKIELEKTLLDLLNYWRERC